MKYLVVDGMLNGTGIRDKYEGGYISVDALHLPRELRERITTWLKKYEQEHYNGYLDIAKVNELDAVGIKIAEDIKSITKYKITYFSNATGIEKQL